jgi:prophage regulatory protein
MQPQPEDRRRNRAPAQSLHAVQIPDALLKIQTVVAVTGTSESSIRRGMAEGTFPQPIKDGLRCTRWVAGDITQWLRNKAARA